MAVAEKAKLSDKRKRKPKILAIIKNRRDNEYEEEMLIFQWFIATQIKTK